LRRGEVGGRWLFFASFWALTVFSSGDKRDKEGDRVTYRCCKALYAWALAMRTRRKPRLFPPESRPYFPRPTESRPYFPRPKSGEIALGRKPPVFPPAPGVREIALGRKSPLFPPAVLLLKSKPPLFPPARGVREIGLGRKPPVFPPAVLLVEVALISPGSWNPITRDQQDFPATLPGRAASFRPFVRYRGWSPRRTRVRDRASKQHRQSFDRLGLWQG
jgi:hypothetical protein